MQTQTEDLIDLSGIQVISKIKIPAQSFAAHGGVLQKFQQHSVLKKFLPPAAKIDFSWLFVKCGEKITAKTRQTSEVLLVCQGQAKLNAQGSRVIIVGDAVLIPPHCAYEIADVSEEGLQMLHLTFPESTPTLASNSTSNTFLGFSLDYPGLVAHNKSLLEKILDNPYFTLLREDKLDNPKDRQVFLDNIQVFSDFFQHMLFLRQATCLDPAFEGIFHEHLQEEFGHDQLLSARKVKHSSHDSILHATSMWYCRQMLILDNLEKTALVHLVLEVSGAYYHKLAKEKLGIDVDSDYYEIHTQVDDIHAEMGEKLLQGHHAEVYRRLHAVIYKGWYMLDTMTRRVAALVAQSQVANDNIVA